MYKRLHRLNFTVSHGCLIRLLDNIGKNFDEEVLKWRDGIASTLDESNEIVTIIILHVTCLDLIVYSKRSLPHGVVIQTG